ncbi:hypothetical protein J7T55_001256 [Diaporthe amygdali]|uniref:uncharacterized protein n=1 Tax=Phomopsis amygdali TaxID=1214568 RepID=UPI0022FEB1FA|nr:uncharacterized protein J7T55_001256 [Diaporthe amygdali]KAJ0103885.1 hypothetical protein J7T55_001256 [Diaporthe amygdali]
MAATETKEAIQEALLQKARHFGFLRIYDYDVNMPLLLNPPESPLPCRETPDEFEAINSSFSARIHNLFNALHDFETSRDGDAFIRADGLQPAIRIINQSFDIYPSKSCLHRNFHSRRLFLRDDHDEDHPATSLPQLLRVTKLRLLPREDYASAVEYANARPVSPRLPLQLATRCPNLRELDCPWLWERTPAVLRVRLMRDFTRPWEGPWRDARHEFGRAVRELSEQLPASLRKARLWFWKPSALYMEDDQSMPMPDLVRPESADPLSLGLRELASHLEEFDLRAFVTPDLFRAPVAWPRMKRLRVEFHPWCPDGTWYFVGPGGQNIEPEGGYEVTDEHYPPEAPNELDDEMDEGYVEIEGTDEEAEYATNMFRTEPLSSKIDPLLFAFAETLKRMPALEEAELFVYLAWQPSEEKRDMCESADELLFNMDRAIYRWGVSYAPGIDGGKDIVTWQVGAWRPQENVMRAFSSLDGGNGEDIIIWKPLKFLDQRIDLN